MPYVKSQVVSQVNLEIINKLKNSLVLIEVFQQRRNVRRVWNP